jgi:hypothetical protein
MTTTATKTYLVGVIERAIAYYKVEDEDARAAAENWQDGEFHDRDDDALDAEGPCNVREKQPDGKWKILPGSEWEAKPHAAPGNKPYSVLLLYPDWAIESGTETFYAFVDAPDSISAVALAQRQALEANEWHDAVFVPLLVTEGHHYGEALVNK